VTRLLAPVAGAVAVVLGSLAAQPRVGVHKGIFSSMCSRRCHHRHRATKATSRAKAKVTVAKKSIGIIVKSPVRRWRASVTLSQRYLKKADRRLLTCRQMFGEARCKKKVHGGPPLFLSEDCRQFA
jgi:hypothetical protein